MSIDLGALPPEVTSARIYSGPGSSSFSAAASAWNAVAAELTSAALSYDTIVTQLTSEEWLGPASAAMAQAVEPYVTWMTNTAAQAEQAASQAQSAAAAFENAFASVVPPQLISANRAELTQALQTNVLGQNNGIIAQLESEYGEMWAQDAAAMYTYASSSSVATELTAFTSSPQIANPAASTTQATTISGSSITSALNQVLNNIPSLLNGLSSVPVVGDVLKELSYLESSSGPFSWLWQLVWGTSAFPSTIFALLTAYSPYASFFYYTEGLPNFALGISNFMTQTAKTLGALGGTGAAAAAVAPKSLGSLGGLLGGGGQVAAGLGNGASIGRLSVPVAWSGASPATHAAASIPVNSVSAAPESGAAAGNLLGGMPLAGAGGRGGAGSGPRYGFRPTVMTRPPSAG